MGELPMCVRLTQVRDGLAHSTVAGESRTSSRRRLVDQARRRVEVEVRSADGSALFIRALITTSVPAVRLPILT